MIKKKQIYTFAAFCAITCIFTEATGQNSTNNALSGYINKTTANVMISSYQNSLASESNPDSCLSSLSFDAAQLRSYLNSDTSLTGVKLTFAHTLEYIDEGGLNQNCGYKSGALTIIISGYDNEGNYKFINVDGVVDYGTPCPTNCPPSFAESPFFYP